VFFYLKIVFVEIIKNYAFESAHLFSKIRGLIKIVVDVTDLQYNFTEKER